MVDKLGAAGEQVTTSRGYARNYLVPRALARQLPKLRKKPSVNPSVGSLIFTACRGTDSLRGPACAAMRAQSGVREGRASFRLAPILKEEKFHTGPNELRRGLYSAQHTKQWAAHRSGIGHPCHLQCRFLGQLLQRVAAPAATPHPCSSCSAYSTHWPPVLWCAPCSGRLRQ